MRAQCVPQSPVTLAYPVRLFRMESDMDTTVKATLAFFVVAGSIVSIVSAAPSFAQNYPTKPIRLIVPFAPGGGSDLLARTVAQKLTGQLGVSVIVENRTGAGGSIGTELVAKSPPDGYTLLLAAVSVIAVNPALYGVQTMLESGLQGLDATSWTGIMVPAGTPRPIIDRLNAEIVKALNVAETRSRLTEDGSEVETSTPEGFAAFIKAEMPKWAKAVKDSGAKAE